MCRWTRPSETGRAAVAGAAMGAAPTAFPHEPQNCAPGVRAVPHRSQNMECPSSTKPYAERASLDQAQKTVSAFLTKKYVAQFDPNFPKSVTANVTKAYQVIAFPR